MIMLPFQPRGTRNVAEFFNLESSTTVTGTADSTAALQADGTSGHRIVWYEPMVNLIGVEHVNAVPSSLNGQYS